jgi:hypothetical protein
MRPWQTQPQEPGLAELGSTIICLPIELAFCPRWLGAGGSFCRSEPSLCHATVRPW